MQQSQRSLCNHALEYAIERANGLKLPMAVLFCLTEKYPGANLRHYDFMLRGLQETAAGLEERGINLLLLQGDPPERIPAASEDLGAALVVTDRGYLRHHRKWRADIATVIRCPFVEVESDAVVPVQTAMDHEAWSAGVLRPKIHSRLPDFLSPLKTRRLRTGTVEYDRAAAKGVPADELLAGMALDRSVAPVTWISPGESGARNALRDFIRRKLVDYPRLRSDPGADCLSGLSPYLHFGQISPLHIVLEVMKTASPAMDPFLEELVVRRELAMNFVCYNDRYDSIDCIPDWARRTLDDHISDRRPHLYAPDELESARTGDPYWNAAQREMLLRGKMHGYMRMYWGKKIMEWTSSPVEAHALMIHLNDRYSLDGRDPGGYAGIAWCFGKHDRPWARRPVFGSVRYMNARGLERKFDMEAYIRRVPEEGEL
jgi:deoxyribodipyrimidine photo-lyase